MASYEQCIQEKKYDIVFPGEVCTIKTARQMEEKLGMKILDPKKGSFWTNEFKETRSHNAAWDASNIPNLNGAAHLCKISEVTSNAIPHCQAQFGAPFTRKKGTTERCVVNSCPPNFELEEGPVTKCKKAFIYGTSSKANVCHERWYDWFTIPNYYLGNTWQQIDSKCYPPCPSFQLPAVNKDPTNPYYTASGLSNYPDQCINKSFYLNGRYANQPEYSPLAWITRLTLTPPKIKEIWMSMIDKDPGNLDYGSNLVNNLHMYSQKVFEQNLANQVSSYEDLSKINEHATKAYSKALPADPRFLNEAYAVCKAISEDRNKYKTAYEASMKPYVTLSNDEIELRMKIIEQSCQHLFCRQQPIQPGYSNICLSNVPIVKVEDVSKVDTLTQKGVVEVRSYSDYIRKVAKITKVIGIIGIILVAIVFLFNLIMLISDFVRRKYKRVMSTEYEVAQRAATMKSAMKTYNGTK